MAWTGRRTLPPAAPVLFGSAGQELPAGRDGAPSGCEDGLLGDELGGHVATNDLRAVFGMGGFGFRCSTAGQHTTS